MLPGNTNGNRDQNNKVATGNNLNIHAGNTALTTTDNMATSKDKKRDYSDSDFDNQFSQRRQRRRIESKHQKEIESSLATRQDSGATALATEGSSTGNNRTGGLATALKWKSIHSDRIKNVKKLAGNKVLIGNTKKCKKQKAAQIQISLDSWVKREVSSNSTK